MLYIALLPLAPLAAIIVAFVVKEAALVLAAPFVVAAKFGSGLPVKGWRRRAVLGFGCVVLLLWFVADAVTHWTSA